MKDITVKVILYAYPALEGLADAAMQAAKNKAALSFRSVRPGEEAAYEVARELFLHAELLALRAAADRALGALDEEERALIARKYFKREGGKRGESGTYYRAQAAAFVKFKGAIMREGVSDAYFSDAFSAFPPFVRLARAIASRTGGRGLFRLGQGSDASSPRGGLRPLMTKSATATAAANTRQMTTI